MRYLTQLLGAYLPVSAALVAKFGGPIIQHAGVLNDGVHAPREDMPHPGDEPNDRTLISIGRVWAAQRNATNDGRTL